MADLSNLIERWQDQNRAWHLEGESGAKLLEKLLELLGYDRSGFRFGTVIESFLVDNPGAMEAIVNWICEQRIPEWKVKLENEIGPYNEENEELEDEAIDREATITLSSIASRWRTDQQEACPGCGKKPGEGYTPGCKNCEDTIRTLSGL